MSLSSENAAPEALSDDKDVPMELAYQLSCDRKVARQPCRGFMHARGVFCVGYLVRILN